MSWQHVFRKAAEGSFPTFSEIRNLELIILEDQRDALLKSSCFNRRAESTFGVSDPTAFVSCCAFVASLLLTKKSNSESKQTRKCKNIFLILLKALIVVILDVVVVGVAL